jgi:hypothetical protein
MISTKSLLAAVAVLVGTTFAGSTEAQYAPYPFYQPYVSYPAPYASSPAQSLPPSWSYNPYTSGFGPCPQRRDPSDPPCSEQMPPTYGQPSFWAR